MRSICLVECVSLQGVQVRCCAAFRMRSSRRRLRDSILLGRQKRAAGELPTAPNGIEIVQRNQLPGPLKTADRPTRHRNLTSWHQRFLLAALGSLNALGLQGSRWRPRPAGRLWERRHAPARSACRVSAGALILQGSRWHTWPAGFAPVQRRLRAPRLRRRSCASSAASIPSTRQLPAPT